MRHATILFSVLLFGLPAAANAAPITFSYQSGAFDYVPNPNGFPDGISAISAIFSVDALPANVTDFASPISLLSMSDGLSSVNDDYQISSKFTTNEVGGIVDIYVSAFRQSSTPLPIGSNTSIRFRQNLINDWMGFAEVDYCWSSSGQSTCDFGHYIPAGGVGRVDVLTPVPEPSTLLLLGSGVASLVAARRRRGVKATSL